ncbi:MAG: TIGR00725 family protein [Planctomycetaceae bacterium]
MRTRMISIVGSGKDLSPPIASLAETLGGALAKAGYGIVSGGMGGVMEAVSRGAVMGRGKNRYPPIVGILPGYDETEGNAYVDVVIPSGLGHARNALVAASGDAMVCVGGATGALSEVALARKLGRPVFTFAETGGTAALAAKAIPAVTGVANVQELMDHLKRLIA